MSLLRTLAILLVALSLATCYTPHPITPLPQAHKVKPRTLFIALDGVDYDLMAELKREGHFAHYQDPIPMVSTFPSSTTVGFTGIFQPLAVGAVPGYEVRFYSHKENRVIGGTPKDIYKIPINYKYFFDVFRHTMQGKALMYTFPGIAGTQDLINIKQVLTHSDKNILMTYIGSTDGSSHLMGRARTKRYLIHMDEFLRDLQLRYERESGQKLRIVMYSDHGFHFQRLKTVSRGEMDRVLEESGFRISDGIHSEDDLVAVRFGLISAGAFFAKPAKRAGMARAISTVKGVDLVFWHDDRSRTIHIRNSVGEEARFEYRSMNSFRYVPLKDGDPLNYLPTLRKHGAQAGQYIDADRWLAWFFDHQYPDAGYRLYDGFYRLVENKAGILFSTLPDYQYGSLPAQLGTYTKLGQYGTHGGLFRDTTLAFAMSNETRRQQPKYLRYDQLFDTFIPQVTRAFRKQTRKDPMHVEH